MAWTTTQTKVTKHTCNNGNGPVFGKKTPGCARCDELIAGAAPREWRGQALALANRKADLAYRNSQKCVDHKPELNPAGYCNICGKGRDFS